MKTNSLNCHRFAAVTFRAIEHFRSEISYQIFTHKSFKQSTIFGMKLVDDAELYQDVVMVLVLFFEQKLRSLRMDGMDNKGKGKERVDNILIQEE